MASRAPFLLWSLYFLLGCVSYLFPHWIYVLPFFLLIFLSKKPIQAVLFFLAGFGLAFSKYHLPSEPKLEGQGVFCLESIQPTQSPFKRSIALKGVLKTFESEGKTYTNIPCTILHNGPPTATKWELSGTLENKERFLFKPDKKGDWKELKSSLSLAHLRFHCKQQVRRYFHRATCEKQVGHFFASIVTGDIDDWLLAMEFRKVGLGHILAISGFHFALLAGMLGALLRSFLPPKTAYLLLLALLLIYFIFLGLSPSVLRAFIMIALYVCGLLLKRRSDPLNLLGIALLIELLLDPLAIAHIGFQLSFLATLGILLFHRRFNQLLQPLLPERKFSIVKQMPPFDQHGYLLSTLIRNALALNLAVYFTTLPAMLYIFHTFPLLSIPYNLFFTPLLGISMMVLPFGLLIPPLGKLNALYTGWILQIIANPPEILNYKIFVNTLSYPAVIALTTILCAIGLTKRWQTSKIETFPGDHSSVG